jgi:hypothetical protein
MDIHKQHIVTNFSPINEQRIGVREMDRIRSSLFARLDTVGVMCGNELEASNESKVRCAALGWSVYVARFDFYFHITMQDYVECHSVHFVLRAIDGCME